MRKQGTKELRFDGTKQNPELILEGNAETIMAMRLAPEGSALRFELVTVLEEAIDCNKPANIILGDDLYLETYRLLYDRHKKGDYSWPQAQAHAMIKIALDNLPSQLRDVA